MYALCIPYPQIKYETTNFQSNGECYHPTGKNNIKTKEKRKKKKAV